MLEGLNTAEKGAGGQYIENKKDRRRIFIFGFCHRRFSVAAFSGGSHGQLFRRRINDTLKLLSPSYRESFQARVDKKQPQAKAAWESLITARHAIVHNENNGAVALTWSDLEIAYSESQRVLQALANALGLTKKQLSQI